MAPAASKAPTAPTALTRRRRTQGGRYSRLSSSFLRAGLGACVRRGPQHSYQNSGYVWSPNMVSPRQKAPASRSPPATPPSLVLYEGVLPDRPPACVGDGYRMHDTLLSSTCTCRGYQLTGRYPSHDSAERRDEGEAAHWFLENVTGEGFWGIITTRTVDGGGRPSKNQRVGCRTRRTTVSRIANRSTRSHPME